MKETLFQHFHPDERAFAQKAADLIERAARRHQMRRTDFLDPRQAFIVESLVRRYPDMQICLSGGYAFAERKRALIAPDYMTLSADEAGVSLLEIVAPNGGAKDLDHGDYLGALTGLGIKREKIGDLHVGEQGCHCLVAEEMAVYIDTHLHQVHRIHVETAILPLDQLRVEAPRIQNMSFTVASLRLDGIIGDVWKLSRAKALLPIKAGRCRVNWKPEDDPSRLLKEGDTVSLKGYGRFVVRAVEGQSKKGRIRLSVDKYI